jgi:hypothetical protein
MRASRIVATAPLAGVDIAAPDPALPHRGPPAARPLDPAALDARGALAAEPHAARLVAGWKPAGAYAPPPPLDPGRADAPARRARIAEDAAAALGRLQRAAAARGARDRGFQRKTLYATTTGEFRVPDNLPAALAGGPFRPGASFRAILRFSNAAATLDGDQVPDQRAVGVRVTDDAGRVQDLTFTSGAAGNHARDARQFVSTMHAAADGVGGGLGRLRALAGLLQREGAAETLRLARTRRASTDAGVSLAALAYYSRSPIEMGEKLVQLALLPVGDPSPALVHDGRDARDGLGRDLALRRALGELRFRLAAAEAPSLADLSLPPDGPWITVGEIRLPRQASGEAGMLRVAARVHAETAMHPFNRWDDGSLRPRGELNEILRGPVYRASAAASGRADDPPSTPQLHA